MVLVSNVDEGTLVHINLMILPVLPTHDSQSHQDKGKGTEPYIPHLPAIPFNHHAFVDDLDDHARSGHCFRKSSGRSYGCS